MKKKIILSSILALGVLGGVVGLAHGPIGAEAAVADNVKTLFEKYYYNGVYTKKTKININAKAQEELKEHFHSKVNSLERTTYYDGDELWMKEANSGYGTSTEGMTHFSKDAAGNNNVDYTVGGLTMESHYATLKDFVEGKHQSAHSNNEVLDLTSGWELVNGVYVSTSEDVIDAFRLFTAPLWIGKTSQNENYLTYTKATVQEVDSTLVMKLYVSGTNDGIIVGADGDSKTEEVFSHATVYRGDYSIKIETEEHIIVINDDSTNEWALAEYMLLGTDVKANDTFELLRKGLLTQPINKYEGNLSEGKFVADNDNQDIYVKFYDGAIDIYASTPVVPSQIARIYYTMPNWSGAYQEPSIYYWGNQSNDWNTTSNSSNMTLSSGTGGWGSTYYYDIDLSKGSLTGIIVKFKEKGVLKQSNDIKTNLPTTAGEYVISCSYSNWSGNTFNNTTIKAK